MGIKQSRVLLLLAVSVVLGTVFFGLSVLDGARDAVPEGEQASYSTQIAKASEIPAGVRGEERDCQGCHVMQPEVVTWKLSSHSEVACVACHGADTAKFEDRESFSQPININAPIPNEACVQCHSPNRVYSPSGDLIIPHQRHEEQGIQCVQCHSGVVHAKIADRDVFQGELLEYDNWDEQAGKKVGTLYYRQPSMWTCISCHKSMEVTTECAACHTDIPGLPSHENVRWKRTHGLTARNDIGECTKCHVTPDKPAFVEPSTGDKAVDFARAQQFCYSCHMQKPQFHENNMLPRHPELLVERGSKNCLACHSLKQAKPGENVTGTYCNNCHWFEPGALEELSTAVPPSTQ